MKIIDLFSGVGGLSLGFEQAGFEVVASVDIWDDAIKTFNHNRADKCGMVIDINKFNDKTLNELLKKTSITGVIGGPPCQGFSTARLSDNGENIHGVNEKRNHLYLEFYKTVKKSNPDFFVIENVRGMVTLNKGAFVKDILDRFGKLGYTIKHEILNAANYGVPQNRNRVFFIGLKNATFEFPVRSPTQVSTSDALSDLPLQPLSSPSKYSQSAQNQYQKLMRRDSIQILNHENTNHSEQTKQIIALIPDGGSIKSLPSEYWEVRKFNKAFQRMNSRLPSLTIDTGHRNYFHFSENRIPTVRESARIQSFPDSFEFLGSKTSQYKQVGNAVPPLLAYQIALQIKHYLKK
jgi:DNA (cytosine-5)-methyltransferase 1